MLEPPILSFPTIRLFRTLVSFVLVFGGRMQVLRSISRPVPASSLPVVVKLSRTGCRMQPQHPADAPECIVECRHCGRTAEQNVECIVSSLFLFLSQQTKCIEAAGFSMLRGTCPRETERQTMS